MQDSSIGVHRLSWGTWIVAAPQHVGRMDRGGECKRLSVGPAEAVQFCVKQRGLSVICTNFSPYPLTSEGAPLVLGY